LFADFLLQLHSFFEAGLQILFLLSILSI